MKPKKKALIVSLIVFLLATAALILLPKTSNLYVAYAACLLALAMMLKGVFRVDKKRIPGGYRRIKRRIWILPASLVVSAAVLVLQHRDILNLPCEMHIVAQLAVLTVGAVKMLEIGTPKKRPVQPDVPSVSAENVQKTDEIPDNKEN